jgi:hypothetical protein
MLISASNVVAQLPVDPPESEQQLEDLTEANEDKVTEDDSYLQDMDYFFKNPVNLNDADAGVLEQMHILSPVQIGNLLSYRKLLGNFINIYELQAVPGWSPQLIKKIRPYITVAERTEIFHSLSQRLKKGDRTLMIKLSQVLERSKGYLLDSSIAKNYYSGSPQKLLVRYKYQFGKLLQYGFTAEKDAGEQFFRGRQKNGFDFYSAHFFIRDLGIIRSLAMGDFSVNLGQGLTQWQSLAFNKGADIVNAKRQSDILQPYNSAGEIAFNRGLGITLQKTKWQMTAFASYRRVDAGFEADTLSPEDYVSSLQLSGLHRTTSELDARGKQGIFNVGGNLSYSTERLHIGTNAVHYRFEHPVQKADYLYNLFALSGKSASNYSVDYSYTFKNVHFFGEAATDQDLDKAFVNGILVNTDSRVSMSFFYRNISPAYQALYGNAFTENTYPTNESGFYSGINLTPNDFLKIDAYADFFHFPWLKYRTDAPTSGNSYMVQLTYKPDKKVEVITRYRRQNKPINYNPTNEYLNPVMDKVKQGWRNQVNYKLNDVLTFRSRIDLLWFDKKGDDPQEGFLIFTDLIYKPTLSSFSANARFSYFETGGYESRMYAFENDVLYGYSIPVFSGKGYRYYLNFNYDLSRKLSVWGKFGQTIYAAQNTIGSGLDEIKGNKKSEVKIQLRYEF